MSAHADTQDVWPGSVPVAPSSTPEVPVVLNQMLSARLGAVVTTRPLSGIRKHELAVPGVLHHAPSSGIHELLPLNPVAVTPVTGPATPAVVPNSAAGGSTVVRSSTGIWLSAGGVPAGGMAVWVTDA